VGTRQMMASRTASNFPRSRVGVPCNAAVAGFTLRNSAALFLMTHSMHWPQPSYRAADKQSTSEAQEEVLLFGVPGGVAHVGLNEHVESATCSPA
jgi:hypothetical protein